jgi:hypothetical protein
VPRKGVPMGLRPTKVGEDMHEGVGPLIAADAPVGRQPKAAQEAGVPFGQHVFKGPVATAATEDP